MKKTSRKQPPPTLPDSAASTCSPESADGDTLSNSQDGQQLDLFGQPVVHVNRSALPGSGKAKLTKDTSGRCSFGSSESASLQRSLVSKLVQMTDTDGSPEFVMTWKKRAMQSGAPIFRLAARQRRTNEAGYFSWPTPMLSDTTGGKIPPSHQTRKHPAKLKQAVTTLLAWTTPMAGTPATDEYNAAGNNDSSRKTVAVMKSWATPRSRDHKNNGASIDRAANGVADSLDLQCKLVCLNGTARPSPLSAQMDRAAFRLNPMHSLWLMGYPAAWACCGERAMQLCRKLPRSSSERSCKRKKK